MNCFAPSITHSPSSSRAGVLVAPASEPASGSVRPKAASRAPAAELGQPLGLLLVGAPEVDRHRAERGVGGERDADRGVDPGQLLDRERVGEGVGAAARRTPPGTGCPSARARPSWRRSRRGSAFVAVELLGHRRDLRARSREPCRAAAAARLRARSPSGAGRLARAVPARPSRQSAGAARAVLGVGVAGRQPLAASLADAAVVDQSRRSPCDGSASAARRPRRGGGRPSEAAGSSPATGRGPSRSGSTRSGGDAPGSGASRESPRRPATRAGSRARCGRPRGSPGSGRSVGLPLKTSRITSSVQRSPSTSSVRAIEQTWSYSRFSISICDYRTVSCIKQLALYVAASRLSGRKRSMRRLKAQRTPSSSSIRRDHRSEEILADLLYPGRGSRARSSEAAAVDARRARRGPGAGRSPGRTRSESPPPGAGWPGSTTCARSRPASFRRPRSRVLLRMRPIEVEPGPGRSSRASPARSTTTRSASSTAATRRPCSIRRSAARSTRRSPAGARYTNAALEVKFVRPITARDRPRSQPRPRSSTAAVARRRPRRA